MIYVCGDSFCVSDPAYGPMWVDLLSQRFELTNLAQVAASNILIAQQVQQAIKNGAEFVLVHGTAVTRGQKRWGNGYQPFSYHTASVKTTPFSAAQLDILKKYYTEFFDLDIAVFENSIVIEHSIRSLVDAGIAFRFDQGGFEHPNFGNVKANWFTAYNQYRSDINLWSLASSRDYRPYYHITDPQQHQRIADYYTRIIEEYL